MKNSTFNTLRIVCEVVISALATCYAALGAIWGWPYIEAVVGSAAAVNTCIGAIVIGLRKAYNNKEEENGTNG